MPPLPADYVKPTPPSPSTNPPGGPTSLPGLQFWLPPYDSSRDFSDWNGYANPLPQQPFQGMEAGSMLDASSNAYHVTSTRLLQPVLYGNDTTIGPYWTFTAPPNASSGTALDVQSSNSNSGLNPTNFDFVQNTGVFTLTTFVNIGASTGGYMTLFDTDGGLTTSPGFSLFVQQDGQLYLNVSTGSAQSVRFAGADAGLSLAQNQWYFLAVVGSGPNNSVQFFAAPVSTSSIRTTISATTLTGRQRDVQHGHEPRPVHRRPHRFRPGRTVQRRNGQPGHLQHGPHTASDPAIVPVWKGGGQQPACNSRSRIGQLVAVKRLRRVQLRQNHESEQQQSFEHAAIPDLRHYCRCRRDAVCRRHADRQRDGQVPRP